MPIQDPENSKRGKHRARTATLADVARDAGVSVMAASRSVSNPGRVSVQTRARVLASVAKLGYVPNLHAASLRSRGNGLIACVIPTLAPTSVFLPTLQVLNRLFVESGHHVMLIERGYDRADDDAVIHEVISRRPDGIVFTGTVKSESARRQLLNSGIPIVETWELTDSPLDMLVGFSHEDAGRRVARYLHGKGRRRLASIASRQTQSMARYRGFRDECLRLGIAGRRLADDTSWIIESPNRVGHGRQALASAIDDDDAIDGIFAITDAIAMGVLTEASVRSVAVPRELAVVGFGDADFAVDLSPSLTTVALDIGSMATSITEMLVARIREQPVPFNVVEMTTSMVERDSG